MTRRREIDRLAQQEKDRLDLIARLRALAEKPSTAAVLKMRKALRREGRFDQDPEVKKVQDELYEKLRESVVYTEDDEPLPAGRRAEDYLPGLVVQPLVGRPSDDGPKLFPDRVVFALARGVLYALRQSDGDVLWAMRVGIDTTHLPLRVPPSGNTPELALVLSADTLTLTAVNARTNALVWEHRMARRAIGRPVIVDRRAYLPTLNGEVHEIELAGGNLLGRYQLGQSLSVGGTPLRRHQADLLPRRRRRASTSSTWPSTAARRSSTPTTTPGQLRGEPILLPSEDDPAVPGYLVLSQAHGLDGTLLRTFRLLPPNPNAAPGSAESRLRVDPVAMPDRRLRGWPWFPPFRDPEKLVTVTDAGVLGLFGIVQAHNKDDALFPLVRVDGERGRDRRADRPRHRARPGPGGLRPGQRPVGAGPRPAAALRPGAGRRRAPRDARPSWKRAARPRLALARKPDRRRRHARFFLVTQSPDGQACLATAVDATTGRVRWQRQLGLVCHGDPQPLGDAVVALDQGGGLFLFDPARHAADAEAPVAECRLSAWPGRCPTASPGSVYLVPGPDGQSVYEFASPESGNRLIVRVYYAGDKQASEHVIELPDRLVGTPAVGESRGCCCRWPTAATRQVRLPLGIRPGRPRTGRPGDRQPATAPSTGHVVWLGGDDFLMTNGQRGLTRWRFRQGRHLRERAGGARGGQADAGAGRADRRRSGGPGAGGGRLEAARVRGRRQGDGVPLRGRRLKQVRRWELKGPITAGPFVRGGRAGCVVGGRRLVLARPGQGRAVVELRESRRGDRRPAAAGRRAGAGGRRVGALRRPRPADGAAARPGLPVAGQRGAGRRPGRLRAGPRLCADDRRHRAARAAVLPARAAAGAAAGVVAFSGRSDDRATCGGPLRLRPCPISISEVGMTVRGIVLAGGKGTRLGELTKVTNKHLLPVGPVPMVYHPLRSSSAPASATSCWSPAPSTWATSSSCSAPAATTAAP